MTPELSGLVLMALSVVLVGAAVLALAISVKQDRKRYQRTEV